MSSVSEPPTSPIPADLPSLEKPVELAPSETAKDEPSFARIVGLVGAFAAFIGGAGLLAQQLDGPKFIARSLAITLVVIGMVGMLFHAARDGEQEVRRTYGFFAIGLIVLSAILAMTNKSIYPFTAVGLFAGLSFISFYLRHETDEGWRKPFLICLGILAATLIGFVAFGAIANRSLLTSSGIILGLLGLGYVCVLISQLGANSDAGRQVTFTLGGVGLAFFAFALLKSLTNTSDTAFFVPTGIILMTLGILFGLISIGLLSDIPLIVMTRRELTGYFYSPIAYFVLLGMTLIGLVNFMSFVGELYREGILEPIVGRFVLDIAGIIAPVCIVPVITMRLLSEEKRSGTYEVLMSVPISELSVVLSKFIAGLAFFLLMWVPWGVYLIALQAELGRPFEYRPLISFMIALAATGGSFVSMGLFFSSLSKNQIIAAVLTFVGMLAFTCLYIFRGSIIANPMWQTILDRMSYLRVWMTALNGQISIPDLAIHASVTVFWLFLTVKALEARRWN